MNRTKGNFRSAIAGDLAVTIKKKNELVSLIQAKATEARNSKLAKKNPVFSQNEKADEEKENSDDEEETSSKDSSKFSSTTSSAAASPQREFPVQPQISSPATQLQLKVSELESQLNELKKATADKEVNFSF